MLSLDVFAELMQPGEPPDLLAAALLDRPEWMADAECAWHPDVDFFPAAPKRGVKPDPEPALAICRRCPVIEECLAWALEHDEAGVWGATTEDQRRAMRRAVA